MIDWYSWIYFYSGIVVAFALFILLFLHWIFPTLVIFPTLELFLLWMFSYSGLVHNVNLFLLWRSFSFSDIVFAQNLYLHLAFSYFEFFFLCNYSRFVHILNLFLLSNCTFYGLVSLQPEESNVIFVLIPQIYSYFLFSPFEFFFYSVLVFTQRMFLV